MKPIQILTLLLIGLSLACATHADAVDREHTYTITAVMRVTGPCDPSAMNDPYQDVRVLAHDNNSYTLEITYYPLDDAVRRARIERFAARERNDVARYLASTPCCNWDAKMRADVLKELPAAGIDTSRKDINFIRKVAEWAMKRSRTELSDPYMPFTWYVDFAGGRPRVLPSLRAEASAEEHTGSSDKDLIERTTLGKSMYYRRCHGACTSTSIYLATIFRALGVPARILYFIPPCDVNDSCQVRMLTDAIHHLAVKETVSEGLESLGGFTNHMFDEVFVDGRWVRLNYVTTDQDIVDANYLGLMTHIDTCADISDTKLASTWGLRSANWPDVSPHLTSDNPYMLIDAWDHFGRYAHVENKKPAGLTKVTVNGVYFSTDPRYHALNPDEFLKSLSPTQVPDMMICIAEWIPNTSYKQLTRFYRKAGHQFVLHCEGLPDVHVHLTGSDCNTSDLRGYCARIDDVDRGQFVVGRAYRLEPVNVSDTYRWTVAPALTVVSTASVN